MKKFLDALNRPVMAYRQQLSGVAWSFVAMTILIVTIFQPVLQIIKQGQYSGLDIRRTIYTGCLGIGSYLLVSSVLWLVCKGFGSSTSLWSYIKTWGISFFPNIICAVVVAVTEVYFYVFWNSTFWGMIFSMVYMGILIWKIILYVLFLREVAQMKGLKLMGAFVTTAIIIWVLAAVNGYVGLKTPIL